MLARSLLVTLTLFTARAFAHDLACINDDHFLFEMSAKLSAARSYSFTAHRVVDAALLKQTAAAEDVRLHVNVLRPNKAAVHSSGQRDIYADGRTLTVYDAKAHTYAAVPMRTSLDGLVNALDANYGFTPPLAEFIVSRPYAEFHREAQKVTYLGVEKVGGSLFGLGAVNCRRLHLQGHEADADLWIGAADRLPRKLVATFHRPGRPQVRVDFSDWNLAAPANAAAFTFTPPAGAEKVEMWTTDRMAAASRKASTRKH